MARKNRGLKGFEDVAGEKPKEQSNSVYVKPKESLTENIIKTPINETVIDNSNTIKEEVSLNSNIDNVTKDVTLQSNPITFTESDELKPLTINDVAKDLVNLYTEKSKKLTVEDTHVRTTFLLEKELNRRLNKLSKGKRGFKTMFMNKAIESLLDELEEK